MKDFRNYDFDDYLRVLLRWKVYFIIPAIMATVAWAYFAWVRPHVFKSQARIAVESAAPTSQLIRPPAGNVQDVINMAAAQIKSRTFLGRIVEQMSPTGQLSESAMENLVSHLQNMVLIVTDLSNTFTIAYYSDDPRNSQRVVNLIANEFIRINSFDREISASEADRFLDEQLRQCEAELAVVEAKISEFRARYRGALPQDFTVTIADLNTLNQQLSNVEDTIQKAQEQRLRLENQVEEERRLAQLLSTLPPREVSSGTAAPTGAFESKATSALRSQLDAKQQTLSDNLLRYTEGHPDVVRLKREVDDLERALKASVERDRAARPAPDPAAADSGGTEAASRTLSYSPDSVATDVRIAEIRTRIRAVEQDIARHEKTRDGIMRQISDRQARINIAPRLEQEYLALSREHDALKARFGTLQGKKMSAEFLTSLETSKIGAIFRILDEANLPTRPEQTVSKTIMMLISPLVGIALGLGCVFLREVVDSTVGSEEMAATEFGLPVLVTIVDLPRQKGMGRSSSRAA